MIGLSNDRGVPLHITSKPRRTCDVQKNTAAQSAKLMHHTHTQNQLHHIGICHLYIYIYRYIGLCRYIHVDRMHTISTPDPQRTGGWTLGPHHKNSSSRFVSFLALITYFVPFSAYHPPKWIQKSQLVWYQDLVVLSDIWMHFFSIVQVILAHIALNLYTAPGRRGAEHGSTKDLVALLHPLRGLGQHLRCGHVWLVWKHHPAMMVNQK